MKFKKENPSVYYLKDAMAGIRAQDLKLLKAQAMRSPLRRARWCTHASVKAPVHEMIIAAQKETYLPPHRHLNKIESYHIVEGRADLVLFTAAGKVRKVIPMGAPGSGLTFYSRVPKRLYHTFAIRSNFIVLHETTNGPLDRSGTRIAPWAPSAKDPDAIRRFERALLNQIQKVAPY